MNLTYEELLHLFSDIKWKLSHKDGLEFLEATNYKDHFRIYVYCENGFLSTEKKVESLIFNIISKDCAKRLVRILYNPNIFKSIFKRKSSEVKLFKLVAGEYLLHKINTRIGVKV